MYENLQKKQINHFHIITSIRISFKLHEHDTLEAYVKYYEDYESIDISTGRIIFKFDLVIVLLVTLIFLCYLGSYNPQ